MPEVCPLCDEPEIWKGGSAYSFADIFRCDHCGHWVSHTDTLEEVIQDKRSRAKIRNYVFNQKSKLRTGMNLLEQPELFLDDKLEWILQQPIPTIAEQTERLVLHLGTRVVPGESIDFNVKDIYRSIGAELPDGITFLVNQLKEKGVIDCAPTMRGIFANVHLSLEGWRIFEQIKTKHESKNAFIAMKFADDLTDFHEAVKQAVNETGFNLFRLDDDEAVRAGSIDDRLKVSIRSSRFIIADLTYENQGVYWEAGFAEGLGKKAILTCREDHFNRVHFDKNHDFVIKWSPDTLAGDMNTLKAVIRNEFFDEVRKDNILDFGN